MWHTKPRAPCNNENICIANVFLDHPTSTPQYSVPPHSHEALKKAMFEFFEVGPRSISLFFLRRLNQHALINPFAPRSPRLTTSRTCCRTSTKSFPRTFSPPLPSLWWRAPRLAMRWQTRFSPLWVNALVRRHDLGWRKAALLIHTQGKEADPPPHLHPPQASTFDRLQRQSPQSCNRLASRWYARARSGSRGTFSRPASRRLSTRPACQSPFAHQESLAATSSNLHFYHAHTFSLPSSPTPTRPAQFVRLDVSAAVGAALLGAQEAKLDVAQDYEKNYSLFYTYK